MGSLIACAVQHSSREVLWKYHNKSCSYILMLVSLRFTPKVQRRSFSCVVKVTNKVSKVLATFDGSYQTNRAVNVLDHLLQREPELLPLLDSFFWHSLSISVQLPDYMPHVRKALRRCRERLFL